MDERRKFLLEQLREHKVLAAELPASAPNLRRWLTSGTRRANRSWGPVTGYVVREFEIDRRFNPDADNYWPGEQDIASTVWHEADTAEDALAVFGRIAGELSLVKPLAETDCPI